MEEQGIEPVENPYDAIVVEIRLVQAAIKAYRGQATPAPSGESYKDLLRRLAYLRERQRQLKKSMAKKPL